MTEARVDSGVVGKVEAAAQPEFWPSRPEAIRFLVNDSLTGLGYLPHRDDPEMAN